MADRMHPQDLRAILVAQLALAVDDLTDQDVNRGIQGANAILAALGYRNETEPNPASPFMNPFTQPTWHCDYCGMVVTGGLYHDCKEASLKARAEKAEARVRIVEGNMRSQDSVIRELRRKLAEALDCLDARKSEAEEIRKHLMRIMPKFGITDWGSNAFVLADFPEQVEAVMAERDQANAAMDNLARKLTEVETERDAAQARVRELEGAIDAAINMTDRFKGKTLMDLAGEFEVMAARAHNAEAQIQTNKDIHAEVMAGLLTRAEKAEARVKDLEVLHPGEWEMKGTIDAMREVDRLRARLAAIDSAREGEPPIPDEPARSSFEGTGAASLWITYGVDLERWGRQGWASAAALRVENESLRALLRAYVQDEDRYNRGEGEPFGSITTETGIAARLAAAAPHMEDKP